MDGYKVVTLQYGQVHTKMDERYLG